MIRNPNITAAARVAAAAIVHGTSADPALEIAQALDDAGLLIRPTGDVSSPAAVAALAECRRAKGVADLSAQLFADMPADPAVTASGGEVQFVVRPNSLTDWRRWTHALGITSNRAMQNTGASMIARFTYGGVRARLVGHGVPALLRDHRRTTAKGTAHV